MVVAAQLWQAEERIIDWKNDTAADVSAGDVVALGTTIFIATVDIPIGSTEAIAYKGMWKVNKSNDFEVSLGDAVFYNAASDRIDNNPQGVFCGLAGADAAGAASEMYVSLCGPDPRRPQSVWIFTNDSGATLNEGDAHMVEDKITIALEEIPDGFSGLGAIVGVFPIPKEAGLAISQGQRVYYDAAAKEIDLTSTNKNVGFAYKGAAAGDANIEVHIGNVWA